MPADLTAAELIALLREHPGACGMLRLTTNSVGTIEDVRVVAEGGRISLYGDDAICFAVDFGCWLTGAAVEKHIELDIAFRNAYGLDEATPAADACELVARLAEIMVGLIEESDKDGVPVNDWTVPLRALIADARRGGGA